MLVFPHVYFRPWFEAPDKGRAFSLGLAPSDYQSEALPTLNLHPRPSAVGLQLVQVLTTTMQITGGQGREPKDVDTIQGF